MDSCGLRREIRVSFANYMSTGILIPIGIFLTAGLFCFATVFFVFRSVVMRSRVAHDDLRIALAPLLERGFQFRTGPASLFAPCLVRKFPNGVICKLHFRIPGRGYIGSLPYDGVVVWLIEFNDFTATRVETIRDQLKKFAGDAIYQKGGRLQWRPDRAGGFETATDLETMVRDLESLS